MWEETSIKYHFHSWMQIRPLSLDSVHAASPSLTSSVSSSLLLNPFSCLFLPSSSSSLLQLYLTSRVCKIWCYLLLGIQMARTDVMFSLLSDGSVLFSKITLFPTTVDDIPAFRVPSASQDVNRLGSTSFLSDHFCYVVNPFWRYFLLYCAFLGDFIPQQSHLGKKVSSQIQF